MKRNSFFVIGLTVAMMAGACSSAGGGRTSVRSDLITSEQIQSAGQNNLFDVVQAIRPTWLRARSPNSFQNPGQIRVYLDDVRVGTVDALRTIPAQNVTFIQWYDPISASARWGLDHDQGAIVVSTRPL